MNAKRVFVAGHRGMAGAAIVRQLEGRDDVQLILRSRQELDLMDREAVVRFMTINQPDEVYVAAAKVGGIQANNIYPADFIHDNLIIETNLIDAANQAGVERLLFLGSSCIYPKHAEQPMAEEALLTGPLEATNEPYAMAKISGIKLCESYNRQFGRDYRSIMPTNLYGPNDNFHPENSHVIPALIRRFHEAKQRNDASVTVWGSGEPLREFLHVDDMAEAAVHVMELPYDAYAAQTEPMRSHINVGTGLDCSIRELAATVGKVVGFNGDLIFDTSMPDGTPRKLLDVSRLSKLGWQAKISLAQGLEDTYRWYVDHIEEAREA